MPSKIIKLESYGSKGLGWCKGVGFCARVGPIQIFQSPTYPMIGVVQGEPHKGVRTRTQPPLYLIIAPLFSANTHLISFNVGGTLKKFEEKMGVV